MWQTRREFLKTTAAGGATVLVSRLLPFGLPPGEADAATMNPPGSWSGSPGQEERSFPTRFRFPLAGSPMALTRMATRSVCFLPPREQLGCFLRKEIAS